GAGGGARAITTRPAAARAISPALTTSSKVITSGGAANECRRRSATPIGSSWRSRYSIASWSARVPLSHRKSKMRSRIPGSMADTALNRFGRGVTGGREIFSAHRRSPAGGLHARPHSLPADGKPVEGQARGAQFVPGRPVFSGGGRGRGGIVLIRTPPGAHSHAKDSGRRARCSLRGR